jgi:hypothetical protein
MAKKLPISDQLRKAISASDKSCYRIWKETGIAPSVLSRFLNHQHGLSMDSVDKLAECLRLRLIADAELMKATESKVKVTKAKSIKREK